MTFAWYALDAPVTAVTEIPVGAVAVGTDSSYITKDTDLGKYIAVVATSADGASVIACATEAVAEEKVDTEPPKMVSSEVADAWTLTATFDKDISKGEGYEVKVTSGSTEIKTVDAVEGSVLKIAKEDGTSFAPGTYKVSIKGIANLNGDVAEDINTEIVKANSFAVGFNAYEGYVAEYDEVKQANTNRYVHVTVADQYGEAMDAALSSSYGTVTVKSTIKSNGSIIGSTFNKSGAQSTVDEKDMAYVTLTADQDFKSGETVVIELTNKVNGEEYNSSIEVEIVGYDLVQTAQTVTKMTATTDKNADISKTWKETANAGSMSLSANNKVFLITSALDSNNDNARKGNIKYISSDTSIVKLASARAATYGETAITSKVYDTDGTLGNAITDDTLFGVWLEAQKEGTATITAYATGFIDKAYTFTVTVEGATLTISDMDAYAGEMCYFPIGKTDGITFANLTASVISLCTVAEDGRETSVATPRPGKYLATASAHDQELGLTEGVAYLTLDMRTNAIYFAQENYKAVVAVTAGTVAKSENTEVTISPRIKVDNKINAASGIYLSAMTQVGTTYATADLAAAAAADSSVTAIGEPAANWNDPAGGTHTVVTASVNDFTDKTLASAKNISFYKTVNVINTAPMQIGQYAAGSIKYSWSADTVGSAKVDIASDYTASTTAATNAAITNDLETSGVALLTITPKTDQLIGKLTLSVGSAEREISVNIGKAVAGSSISAEAEVGDKAMLIDGSTNSANALLGTQTDEQILITVKDQYGDPITTGLNFNAADGTPALRLKDAPQTTPGGNGTIAGEITVAKASGPSANGLFEMNLSAIYPGKHSLTFYIGKYSTEIEEDDPQVTIDVNFVQRKDLTAVVPDSAIKFSGATAGDLSDVVAKFPDASGATSSAEVKGAFFETSNDHKLTPSAKVYAGDVEVAGVPIVWSILDSELSFTETWIATNTTPAGSQTITSEGGTTGSWVTTDGIDILFHADGQTTIGIPSTDAAYDAASNPGAVTERSDATIAGVWSTGTAQLDSVMTFVQFADSGKKADVSATVHLNVNVTNTDLDAQSYVRLSDGDMDISVDDAYLVYPARNDVIGVKAGEKVEGAIKVKAGSTTGTVLRVMAVDSVYGAELYDETTSGGRYETDSALTIVGTDATAVDNGSGATDGVVTVKANAGTAGKTASLRLQVKSGSKTRYLTVPLEILK